MTNVVISERVFGHPGADAVRISGGRIDAIGVGSQIVRPGVSVDRVAGTILPAMRDSHIHPVGLAGARTTLDASRVTSLAELRDRLHEHADRRRKGGDPLIVTGLDDEKLASGTMPSRWELDAIHSARPVIVYRHCSHIAAVNTISLRVAGVDDATPDPAGGRFQRTPAGVLTGVLEEAAIASVTSRLSRLAGSPDRQAVLDVLHGLRRRGVVAIDAMVSAGAPMWCAGGNELETLLEIADATPIAIDVYVIADTPNLLRSAHRRLGELGGRVRFAGWKGFADGSLGGRTAALRAPYHDDPTTSGLDRTIELPMEEMAQAALALGGRASIHAIGDLAVAYAIELAEQLGPDAVRVEHASVVDPEQVERMAAAGVTASIQPSFVASDTPWLAKRLGPERAKWAYPFRSMRAAGIRLLGGSDAPIEAADPFVGIRDATGARPESLEVEEAIELYAAGVLAEGEPATFIVTDEDPSLIGPDQISAMEVAGVWINGARVQ